MRHLRLQVVTLTLLLESLTGCAAVVSEEVGVTDGKPDPTPDGIPYFLPRRPFVITVAMPGTGNVPTVTVASGTAEPYLSKRFALKPGINLLANNEFNVTVGPNGLLETSNSNATSQVATTVQNAAATVASFAGLPNLAGAPRFIAAMQQRVNLGPILPQAAPAPPVAPTKGVAIACPPRGSAYQYLAYPEDDQEPSKYPIRICGGPTDSYTFQIMWKRADGGLGTFGADNATADKAAKARSWFSGLFFRHELPYLVTVETTLTGGNSSIPSIANYALTSPDESETDFFPINRSFFANNTANITITDGVLTAVDQTTQSEVAAAVGMPAVWLSSYTTALGQLLSGLTNISGDQQKLLQQLQATALTQSQSAFIQYQANAAAVAQYQLCVKAVATNRSAMMDPNTAQAAAAAIQAACLGGS
jgi:hypothetical protein